MMSETPILDYIEANAHLKRCVSERDAEIERLRQQVDVWQTTGNAIMLCAVGREAPLSDSDVRGEINALRQQVAELQAWKDAVPVDAINAWWQSPVNWTGYDHAQYDAWYKEVKTWVHGLKVND